MSKGDQILLEILGYLIMVITMVLPWYLTISLMLWCGFFLFLAPLFLILSHSLGVALIRALTPPLKKGVYPVDLNKGYISWFIHLYLLRSAQVSGIYKLALSLPLLRSIFFKGHGASISSSCFMPNNTELCDFPLLTLEEGVYLGDHVKISAHYLSPEKLILRPVTLRSKTKVSTHTQVKPGSSTKEGDQL